MPPFCGSDSIGPRMSLIPMRWRLVRIDCPLWNIATTSRNISPALPRSPRVKGSGELNTVLSGFDGRIETGQGPEACRRLHAPGVRIVARCLRGELAVHHAGASAA